MAGTGGQIGMQGNVTLLEIVSPRTLNELGKYRRDWNHFSSEALEVLLWVIGCFGNIYNKHRTASGEYPEPVFRPHGMWEPFMTGALKMIAKIQAGEFSKKDWGPGGEHFRPEWESDEAILHNPQAAFSEAFAAKLAADPGLQWAAKLNECQLFELLWRIGEYTGRVNQESLEVAISRMETYKSSINMESLKVGTIGYEFPPPTFNMAAKEERVMRRALRMIALIKLEEDLHRGKQVKPDYAKKYVLQGDPALQTLWRSLRSHYMLISHRIYYWKLRRELLKKKA